VDEGDEPGLVVTRAPSGAKAPTLGAALDALTGRGWRATADEAFLRALGGPAAMGPRALALSPESPAHLLLLRPTGSFEWKPDALRLEGTWVDGRPVRVP
jgi:hypothetical protein